MQFPLIFPQPCLIVDAGGTKKPVKGRDMQGIRGLFLLAIMALGVIATYFTSEALKTEARRGWEQEAKNTAQSLTGTLLGWLEESYAPISGLATLAEGSDMVTEVEFLTAFDSLEARATAFFLNAAALIEPVPGSLIKEWWIKHSTAPDGVLKPATPLSAGPDILNAVRVAKSRFGETILSEPVKSGDGGGMVSPVTLAIDTKAGQLFIMGLVDYRAMISSLKELRVPAGAGVNVKGRFPGLGGPGPERVMVIGGIKAPLYSVPTRAVTAGAELVITWDFDARFSGGPPQKLATFALIAGFIGSAFITLLLAVFMRQNRLIMRRVTEATRELGEKDAQLNMALGNMASGLFMIDADMKLRVFSERVYEFYGLPRDTVKVGAPLEGMIRIRAERGDYGEGDPETLIQQRLDGYRQRDIQTVTDHVEDRIYEVHREPTDDGGVVCIINDVTEREKAAQVVRDSEAKLRELLDSAPVSISIVDQTTNERLFVNRRLVNMLGGTSADQIAAVDLAESYVNSDDAEMARRAVAAGGTLENAEIERRRLDGSTFWTLQNSQAIDGFRGRNARVVWMVDISELKRAEAEVAKQEQQLRTALDTMTDGIYVLDKDMNYALFNEQYRRMADLGRDAICVGGPVENVLREHASRGDYGAGAIDDLVAKRLEALGNDEAIEREMSVNNGERFVALKKAPMQGGGAVVVATDITDRKRSEGILIEQRRSIQLLHDIAEAAQAAGSLDEAYQICLVMVCAYMDWPIGHVYVLSEETPDLAVSSKVWHLADPKRFAAFRKATEKISFMCGEGLPGRVLENGEAAWIADVTEDPNFPRAAIAEKCGVKAGFAFPVTSEHGVIAILEFFATEAEEPDERTLAILASVGNQLGSIILRKRAEAEIAEKEAQLRITLDNMPGGIRLVDKDRRYVLSNPLYSEMFDFPDDLLKVGDSVRVENLFQANRGDFGDGDPEVLTDEMMSAHKSFTEPTNWERMTGKGRILDCRTQPTTAGGYVSIITDITERKRAEEAIAAKEAQLRNILESSPYGVSIIDEETRERIFSNPRFNEMFTGDRNVSMDHRDIAESFADPQDLEEYRQTAAACGWDFDTEVLRKRIDGSTWWSMMSVRPIDFENRPAQMIWQYDTTERMNSEATARRLREAMEVFTDSIILYDKDEHVVFTNDRYHELYPNSPPKDKITGFTQEQLLRRSLETGLIDDPVAESDPETWLAARLEERRSDRNKTGDTQHSSGRTHFYRHRPTTDGGLIIAQTDITERKQAEEEITRAHGLITESIDYASNIQRSALPDDGALRTALGNHFVIWEPCEQVGGDIYWHRPWGGGDLVILADCTGHGVPGAFMTLIAGGALDRALIDTPAGDCAALIQRMHQIIQHVLGQDREEGYADDGLELGVCFLPENRNKVRFAGANISLYIQEEGEVQELRGDRKEIGYRRLPFDAEFANHVIEAERRMSLFMTTDGLPTQVGEETRLPFSKRGFKRLLESLGDVPMSDKADGIMTALRSHMGARPQRDDISLIGFEIDAKN